MAREPEQARPAAVPMRARGLGATLTSGLLAGFAGGVVFGLVLMAGAAFQGNPIYSPFQMIGDFFFRRGLPMPTTPIAFLSVWVGVAAHLVVAAFWGMIFALLLTIAAPWVSAIGAPALGIMFGLAVWAFDFYIILSWAYPEMVAASPIWLEAISHGLYGLTLGLIPVVRPRQTRTTYR